MANEKYEDAINAFSELGSYKNSKVYLEQCTTAFQELLYNEANSLMNAGKYSEAIVMFKKVYGYKDSRERIKYCEKLEKYVYAMGKIDEKDFSAAILSLHELDDFMDSSDILTLTVSVYTEYLVGLSDEMFLAALSDMNDIAFRYVADNISSDVWIEWINRVELDTGLGILNRIGANKLYSILTNMDKTYAEKIFENLSRMSNFRLFCLGVKQGDVLSLGSYEQDGNAENGAELIEWIVLAKENNRMLLISKYALDVNYNDGFSSSSKTSVTWENSYLREWLNGTFKKKAFGTEILRWIGSYKVKAEKNPRNNYKVDPGNDTYDQIFLLSASEADLYFENNDMRKLTVTNYVKTREHYSASTNDICEWWLRTPGGNDSYFMTVDRYGGLYERGERKFKSSNYWIGVRPAVWLDY